MVCHVHSVRPDSRGCGGIVMPRSNKSGVSHAVFTRVADAEEKPEQVRVVEDAEWVGESGPELTDIPAEEEVRSFPGNSSSTSPARRASSKQKSEKSQRPAPTTESH